MTSKSVVALLPMKANSERIRGKNFRDLAGRPLFRWVLDELLKVDEIQKVVINTDARSWLNELNLECSERVQIRDRDPELCGDLVSMNRILANDIANVDADAYLMTHTTNPLITAKTIKEGLMMFLNSRDHDSVFSVNRTQARFYDGSGKPLNHDPNNLIRTQDLEPWYEENSCLYYFSRKSFLATGARIGASPAMFETPPLESFDIDEPHDWEIVAAMARGRELRG